MSKKNDQSPCKCEFCGEVCSSIEIYQQHVIWCEDRDPSVRSNISGSDDEETHHNQKQESENPLFPYPAELRIMLNPDEIKKYQKSSGKFSFSFCPYEEFTQIGLKYNKTEKHEVSAGSKQSVSRLQAKESTHQGVRYESLRCKEQHMKYYICAVCERKFNCLAYLKDHEQTHSRNREFPCSHCSYRASTQIVLKCHNTRTHKNSTRYRPIIPERKASSHQHDVAQVSGKERTKAKPKSMETESDEVKTVQQPIKEKIPESKASSHQHDVAQERAKATPKSMETESDEVKTVQQPIKEEIPESKASSHQHDVAQVSGKERTKATPKSMETESDEVKTVQQPIKEDYDIICLSSDEEVDENPASTAFICPICTQPHVSALRLGIHILDQHTN